MSTLVERLTREQMNAKAEKAEARCRRYEETQRKREEAGLDEEALDAERMRLDSLATAMYWRNRAAGRS